MIATKTEGERGCGYRKPGGLYLVGGSMTAPCGGGPIPLRPCECCSLELKQHRAFGWFNPALLFEAMKPTARKPGSSANRCPSGHCPGCPFSHPPERAGIVWIGKAHYPTWPEFMVEAETMGLSRRIGPHLPRDFWNEREFSVHYKAQPIDSVTEGQPQLAIEGLEIDPTKSYWHTVKVDARDRIGAELAGARAMRKLFPRHRWTLDVVWSRELAPAVAPLVFVAHPEVVVQADGSLTPGIFTSFVAKPERVGYAGMSATDEKLIADAKRGIDTIIIEREGE